MECINIRADGMSQIKECEECEHYPQEMKIHDAYPVKQLLDMLPKTIIKHRKSFFYSNEIFDLRIEKDSLNNWHISYVNDRDFNSLYSFKNKDIHWCASIIIAQLIINKYLPE
jgi:hypothetical protein